MCDSFLGWKTEFLPSEHILVSVEGREGAMFRVKGNSLGQVHLTASVSYSDWEISSCRAGAQEHQSPHRSHTTGGLADCSLQLINWSVSPTLGHSLASPQSAPVPPPLPSHQFGVLDEKTEMNVLYMGERPSAFAMQCECWPKNVDLTLLNVSMSCQPRTLLWCPAPTPPWQPIGAGGEGLTVGHRHSWREQWWRHPGQVGVCAQHGQVQSQHRKHLQVWQDKQEPGHSNIFIVIILSPHLQTGHADVDISVILTN